MIIGVYKPKGPTSNDVLRDIRRIVGPVKVGHAGTLDPLAEGVLVVGIGRDATKTLSDVVKKEKEYVAEVTLGIVSTTDDEEGEKENKNVTPVDEEEVNKVVQLYIGETEQVPPVYSAVKIDGKEAYKRARKGEDIVMPSRSVRIYDIEVLSYKWPKLEMRVVTGPGVYIRALARDIGESLGVGGYLSSLVRTRVGDFYIDNAIKVEEISEKIVQEDSI